MGLTDDTRHLLLAYDSFTNFAGGPDLPWVVDVYETLDDDPVQTMVWSLCYAWAVGQRAAGCYENSIEGLAQSLFWKLPTWDDRWSQDRKAAWLNQLGIQMVLPEPDPRPLPAPLPGDDPSRWSDLDSVERNAIEDMAAYFQLGLPETILLYQLGRALHHVTPTLPLQIQPETPPRRRRVHNGH
jgi:hypothetical protein